MEVTSESMSILEGDLSANLRLRESCHDVFAAEIGNLMLAKQEASGSDVLTLNVGGKETVATLRSTLTHFAGSKLAEMFSGRWDSSFPRDKDGNIFIDVKPELFLPLLDFLRCISALSPFDAACLPPTTPSFSDPLEERAFRRLVDGYDLTNVFYNCEIFKHRWEVERFNSRSVVSRQCSIFDCVLSTINSRSQDKYLLYSLDRPNHKYGACHVRQIQAFEVALRGKAHCCVGWMRRDMAFADDVTKLRALKGRIFFDSGTRTLNYRDREGVCHISKRLLVNKLAEDATIRCCKNAETQELEWHVNGVLVATTSRSLDYGNTATVNKLFHLGWSASGDDWEMVPCVQVCKGSCSFSAVELEP